MDNESEPRFSTRIETSVSMPHLDKSLYNIETGGEIRTISRWDLICEELSKLKWILIEKKYSEDESVIQLAENCIRSYNPNLDCSFEILKDAYREISSEEIGGSILTFMIECVLTLPKLFPGSIELLNGENCTEAISLSKDQICCLLANAFFSTFPDRDKDRRKFREYPRINFTELFDDKDNSISTGQGWRTKFRQAKIEKVKCFLNYFCRMKERFGTRDNASQVIFERRSLSPDEIPQWKNITNNFLNLKMYSSGVIEDSVGSLQVEFANKFIGGGTLGNGAAMEEIRVSCYPELVVGQLFTKMFYPLDSLLVHRFEQFSSHSGYGASFKYARDHLDINWEHNHICAIDAHQYPRDSGLMQFEKKWIDRELNKCVSAFQKSDILPNERWSKIASGKWGCGIFNGDPLLKSIIQWMAASYCGKHLELYTFQDVQLVEEMEALQNFVKTTKCSVGQLYKCLVSFRGHVKRNGHVSLLDYFEEALQNGKDEFESEQDSELETDQEDDDDEEEDTSSSTRGILFYFKWLFAFLTTIILPLIIVFGNVDPWGIILSALVSLLRVAINFSETYGGVWDWGIEWVYEVMK